MTEKEMREARVPTFETVAQLMEYITDLRDKEHDYGTAVYATSMAAVATFNYMARFLGVTGFQASCADLDILRRTRSIQGPFMVLTLDRHMYPQYDIVSELEEFISENEEWIAQEAKQRLAENEESSFKAADVVVDHWKKLAGE